MRTGRREHQRRGLQRGDAPILGGTRPCAPSTTSPSPYAPTPTFDVVSRPTRAENKVDRQQPRSICLDRRAGGGSACFRLARWRPHCHSTVALQCSRNAFARLSPQGARPGARLMRKDQHERGCASTAAHSYAAFALGSSATIAYGDVHRRRARCGRRTAQLAEQLRDSGPPRRASRSLGQ